MGEKEIKKRRVFLTSRQIGLVASFGGLAFAWSALGIQIPMYPPFIIDIREPLVVLVSMAAGPWAALITGIVTGFPIYAFCNLPYYVLIGVFTSLFGKIIWKLAGWKRYLGLTLICFAAEYVVGAPWAAYSCEIIFGIPFWDLMHIFWIGGVGAIYAIEEIIAVGLAMKFAPSLMEPRWLWKGGEAPPKVT